MLLAALLLFLLAGPSAAQTDAAVSCDSEAELLGSLTWVRDACSQAGAGEQFDDDDTLVPTAVTTAGCAAVVRRVASDCGGLLARSPWFASRRAALGAAAAAASALIARGARALTWIVSRTSGSAASSRTSEVSTGSGRSLD